MSDAATDLTAPAPRPFDADNHYYEALDAFSRHLPAEWGPRTIQWAEIDGRMYHVVGGRVSRAVVNATFDPVAKPGVLRDYFRGNPNGDNPIELLKARDRISPAYRDRDARLDQLDDHGLDAVWMFPTLGMIYEEQLKHDPEAVAVTFKAFNRWVAEDWGFEYKDRIFAAPYISLADIDAAVAELRYGLDNGARTVVMRPAAPTTRDGQKPPTHPDFDPFWALANEAGITVVVHAGDTGYTSNGYANDGFSSNFKGGIPQPIKFTQLERAIEDFLASLVCDQLFVRFPNLRVASVENGSGFLRGLFGKLNATANKMAGWFSEHPVDAFKQNIWINPFWEDDVHELLDLMGPDKILFGSDWPHIEGMPRPLDYLEELEGLDADTIDKITRRNVLELNQLRPA
ncbi:MAG TPA: amidohydrolase family protein [Microthrixaceae bacterium]|nr:amidohydrolase family protein [Microthrixaceae bacterium]